MKINEIIDRLSNLEKRWGDLEVRIITNEPSVGWSSSVGIDGIYAGIDWDKGKIFIYPAKELEAIK